LQLLAISVVFLTGRAVLCLVEMNGWLLLAAEVLVLGFALAIVQVCVWRLDKSSQSDAQRILDWLPCDVHSKITASGSKLDKRLVGETSVRSLRVFRSRCWQLSVEMLDETEESEEMLAKHQTSLEAVVASGIREFHRLRSLVADAPDPAGFAFVPAEFGKLVNRLAYACTAIGRRRTDVRSLLDGAAAGLHRAAVRADAYILRAQREYKNNNGP